jgi:1,4-alpha-glucan branching enzyme
MLKKSYSKTGRYCRVTFELPPEIRAESASLCGEFNQWDPSKNPMTRRKDGRFTATVSLETGKDYRFKYKLDGEHWENDIQADAYVPNVFATEDSVVKI